MPGRDAGMPSGGAAKRPTIASSEEADRLLTAIEAVTTQLADLLTAEAAEIAAGHIATALSTAPIKAEVTGRYLRDLEIAKANAVALKRLAPDRLGAIKNAQARLHVCAMQNQAVLATARAVSENLIKNLSEELTRLSRPSVYQPTGRTPPLPRTAGPLVLSRSF